MHRFDPETYHRSRSAEPLPADRPPDETPARPTLLVFTLGAVAEGRRRRLLPEAFRDRETALYRACLDEVLAAGRACGFRLEVSTPAGTPCVGAEASGEIVRRDQASGDFGERLAAAFDAAGPAPGSPVVVVGTDTPGLAADHLRRSAEALLDRPGDGDGQAAGRAVIGPSPDGGLYLLAASRPLGEILRRVPWRRRGTLAALRRALERAGLRVHLLAPLADLDRPADLEGWLARRQSSSPGSLLDRIAAGLDRLLAALRTPATAPGAGRLLPAPVPVRAGRAPPRT